MYIKQGKLIYNIKIYNAIEKYIQQGRKIYTARETYITYNKYI